VKKFLSDFKEGSLESKGWPRYLGAYIVSKAAMNGYTRILAKKNPSFCINSVCPGYVKTDITSNTGLLTVEEGAASPVRLALLPNGSPSGLFYYRTDVASFWFPVMQFSGLRTEPMLLLLNCWICFKHIISCCICIMSLSCNYYSELHTMFVEPISVIHISHMKTCKSF